MRKVITILIFLLIIAGCSTKAIFIPSNLQEEACRYEYCRVSEDSVSKALALRFLTLAASSQGVELNLNKGICTELYTKRDIDYRYAFKSAKQICNGE